VPAKTTLGRTANRARVEGQGSPAVIAGGVSSIRINVKTALLDPPEPVAVHVALAERVPPLNGVEASTVRLASTQTTSTVSPWLSVAVPVGVTETLMQAALTRVIHNGRVDSNRRRSRLRRRGRSGAD